MSGGVLYPSKCIFCGGLMQQRKWICSQCAADDILITGKVCKDCGLEVSKCMCMHRKHFYERRISCVYYTGGVRRGISRFKFHRHTMLAFYYGSMMAANVKSKYIDIAFDYAVCVPMRRWDEWRRGYNCAELLAKEVAKQCDIPFMENGLYKRRHNKSQKSMPLSKRAANVLDAFAAGQSELLAGKTILLIDDVITSGATVNECAKVLKLAGAEKVYVASLAAVAVLKKS